MMTEEEWGPWIEHDGKSVPVRAGEFVHLVFYDGDEWIGVEETSGITKFGFKIVPNGDDPWSWIYDKLTRDSIIRYRIRKPKGMKILEGILENLPKEVDA